MTLSDRFTVRRGDLSYEATAPGLELIATGTPEDPAYRIDASRLTAEGPGVAGGGMVLALVGTEGRLGPEDTALDAAAVSLELIPAGEGATGEVLAERQDVALRLDGAPGALFAAGADPFDLSIRSATGSQTVATQGASGQPATVRFDFGPSEETLVSDGAELSIRQAAEALSVTASGPGVPLQGAGAAIASSRMSARVPVAGGEAEAPFELVSELSGIVLEDAVWAAIDPGEELPRDPGALSLHITGDGRMGADGQLAPRRVALREFALEMLGASVTGQGAVEFVVPPVPGETAGRPVGALAFTMTGSPRCSTASQHSAPCRRVRSWGRAWAWGSLPAPAARPTPWKPRSSSRRTARSW